MTARTRRRLLFCLVIGVLTLPVEFLLLPVARIPDAASAAQAWAADLSPPELGAATARIEDYPAHYCRALMGALPVDDRARVWRDRFDAYLASHPELTADQRQVLVEARSLITAEAFRPPLEPDLQARINAVFDRATKVLPGHAARELFVTLGPREPVNANALPLSQRLADRVRGWRVANANGGDCTCNVDVDTCDVWPESDWLQCSEQYTCDMDLTWPMCGPLWSWACTGWCKVIVWPHER